VSLEGELSSDHSSISNPSLHSSNDDSDENNKKEGGNVTPGSKGSLDGAAGDLKSSETHQSVLSPAEDRTDEPPAAHHAIEKHHHTYSQRSFTQNQSFARLRAE